jgi:hypothetical protein
VTPIFGQSVLARLRMSYGLHRDIGRVTVTSHGHQPLPVALRLRLRLARPRCPGPAATGNLRPGHKFQARQVRHHDDPSHWHRDRRVTMPGVIMI